MQAQMQQKTVYQKNERLTNRSAGAGVVEVDVRHSPKHRGTEDLAAR